MHSTSRHIRFRRPLGALCASALAVLVVVPTASAAAAAEPPRSAQAVLHHMGAPAATTADGPVWSPVATGFASVRTPALPDGTTGGAGGETVIVRDAESLAARAAEDRPLTILVAGEIVVGDGGMITVTDDKTIAGTASGGEIVDGGLFVDRASNVIIRNLTFRDSYVAGDWDGKSDDNDNDGIRIDTSDHVWIDHNEFARLGDGQLDVRKDSTAVTASWNHFHDHNKTLGVGWTSNLVTTLTLHHNRFSNVHQRNGSIDNVAYGHVYNNWISGASSYGMNSRGGSTMLVESSVFEHARQPLMVAETARLHQRDNLFSDVWLERPAETGPTFEASQFYEYTADPVADVVDLLTRFAGTTKSPSREKVDTQLTVAQDGSGDFLSIHAAVGAASRADHKVEIVVRPGVYREVVSVWPGAAGLAIRGATGDPADVVVTYDKMPALTVHADDVTLGDLTIENSTGDEYAFVDSGERTTLDDVTVVGDQLTGDPR